MIRLTKGAKPRILRDNAVAWTEELARLQDAGEPCHNVERQYAHPCIRTALRREGYSKCMYCESRIRHVAYDNIEHFRPKGRQEYRDLTFEWENLGLACPVCNTNKGTTFSEDFPFVDPYSEDPLEFIVPRGPMLIHRRGEERGKLTINVIRLNRKDLMEARHEKLRTIEVLLSSLDQATDSAITEGTKKAIIGELTVEQPYAMFSRDLVASQWPELVEVDYDA